MKKRLILVLAVMLNISAFAEHKLKTPLLPRQPEWKTSVVERYYNGQDKTIEFSHVVDGKDRVVKRYNLSEKGELIKEEDLCYGMEGEKEVLIPHGASVSLFDGKAVKQVVEYNRGTKDGLEISYFENGKEQKVANYKDGKLDGRYAEYFADGTKKIEAFYINDNIEGELWNYYPSGKRKSKLTYKDGELTGEGIGWYESGVIESQSNYLAGDFHDTNDKAAVVTYFEEGSLKSLHHYKNGKKHGDTIIYHQNGNKQIHQIYAEDKLDGKNFEYSEGGELIGSGSFKAGNPIGEHKRMGETGRVLYLARYDKNGILQDYITEYNERGILTAKFFKQGDNFERDYFVYYDSGNIHKSYHFKNGKLHGDVEEFYENGKTKLKASYVDGVVCGVLETWYEDGLLTKREMYKDGKINGSCVVKHPNGEIASQLSYKNGKPHGEITHFYDTGIMKGRIHFNEGVYNGDYFEYFADGSIKYQATFVDGKIEGKMLKYFDKDTICNYEEYKDGKPHGAMKQFYPDGQLYYWQNFVDGSLNGKATGYYENGTKAFARHYNMGKFAGQQLKFYNDAQSTIAVSEKYNEEGKREGEQKTFFPDGSMKSIIIYKNDEMHGKKEIYNEEGEVIESANYHHGRVDGELMIKGKNESITVTTFKNGVRDGKMLVYYPLHPKHGQVLFLDAVCKNGELHGPVKKFHGDGSKSEEYQFEHGLIEGKAHYYSPEGYLVRDANFQKGIPHGEVVDYYADGQVKKKMSFQEGRPEGEELIYFNDGKIQHQKSYVAGKLHGLAKSFNENGILVFEAEYKEGLKEGIFNKYYDDGRPRLFQTYEQDKQISKQSFDK